MTQSCRNVELPRASALACLLALLSACGGRPEQTSTDVPVGSTSTARTSTESVSQADVQPRSTTEINTRARAATVFPRGVLLAGLPGDNAYAALQTYVVGDREAAVAHKSATASPDTPPLNATLDLAATVGQVNTALGAVGARIVVMQPGHKTLTIELAAVKASLSNQQAAASLLASRAFQWVQGPGLPILPDGLTADPADSEPAENLDPRPRRTTDAPTP